MADDCGNCGREFRCARCGKRRTCGPDNLHELRICKTCCAYVGIEAILAQQVNVEAAPAELAISASPRIGMTERAVVDEILNMAYADSRLSDELYDLRSAAVSKAVTQRDLDLLTADLKDTDRRVEVFRKGSRVSIKTSKTLMVVRAIPIPWLLFIIWIVLMNTVGRGK